jgi:hypothetical protein
LNEMKGAVPLACQNDHCGSKTNRFRFLPYFSSVAQKSIASVRRRTETQSCISCILCCLDQQRIQRSANASPAFPKGKPQLPFTPLSSVFN